jgi:hypothetical protein
VSHESVTARPWSDMPWLDLRCAELKISTPIASVAIYRAAKILWQAGVPDNKAADVIVLLDSQAFAVSTMGPEDFVVNMMNLCDPGWLERGEV